MMQRSAIVTLLVVTAALGVRAHANAQPITPQSPVAVRTQHFLVPAAFGASMRDNVTMGPRSNGRTMKRADLLDKFDPAQKITVKNGKTITVQDLIDRLGRAEDQMRQSKTSLASIPMKRALDASVVAKLVQQKQRVAADRTRIAGLKSRGWEGTLVEHPATTVVPAPPQPPSGGRAFTMTTNGHHKTANRLVHYACAVDGDFERCIPMLAVVDAPWDSGVIGDTSSFGASTQLSVTSGMGQSGDISSCAMTWTVNGWAFDKAIPVLSLNASATTNARAQTFGGSIGITIIGQTASLGGDDEGDASWSIHQEASMSAGGKIPLLGPLYVQLTFDGAATFDAKLIGERTSQAGVGVKGFNGTNDVAFNGAHCHVGVEPSIDSKIGGGIGLGIGISDLVDILNISVNGEAHPLSAKLPANVTLDILRAPPSGGMSFDAHLTGSIMSSKVWVHYQFFDICADPFGLGQVCLVADIFGLPTSGDITVYEDGGIGYDDDLVGGKKSIAWKSRAVAVTPKR